MPEQYRCLNDVLLPALAARDILLLGARRLDSRGRRSGWSSYFELEVEPVLSPLGLDPARPFPRIQNKSLNFIVRLEGKDAFGRDSELAIVQAPRSLPRVVPLPVEGARRTLVLLTGIVQAFVQKLFAGIKVVGCYQFRVTRNSDLFVDEEEIDDLRRALEGELAHRRYGAAVRLETSNDCPADIVQFLLRQFALPRRRHLQRARDRSISTACRRCTTWCSGRTSNIRCSPRACRGAWWATPISSPAIRQKDILLHHPYQSFAPVMDFLRQAAADPNVLAIKQTLYRTGSDSPIVDALVAAAGAGKDVTVIIELRARFDEEANIELSNRLQEAGAHVMYGVVGYKTHAKLAHGRAPRAGRHPPLLSSRHRQLSPAHGPPVHRLRPLHLRRRGRPGRARALPAAHQPHADTEAEPPDPVAVRHARDRSSPSWTARRTTRAPAGRRASSPR